MSYGISTGRLKSQLRLAFVNGVVFGFCLAGILACFGLAAVRLAIGP